MILGDSRLRGNGVKQIKGFFSPSFPRRRESILSYVLLNKPFCSFLHFVCERDSSGNPLPIPMAEIVANSPVRFLAALALFVLFFEDF